MSAVRSRWNLLQLIPRQEIWICFGAYIGIVIGSIYTVYCASDEKADILSYDLKPGWIPGRRRDSSDFEWSYWSQFYYANMLWYIGYVVVSLLVRGSLFKGARRRSILFLYSLVAMCDILSMKLVTFLLCQCCIVYLVALFGQRRVMVWIASLVILSTLNFRITIDYLRTLCDVRGQYTALMFTMAMYTMRYVSFGVDMCDRASAAAAAAAAAAATTAAPTSDAAAITEEHTDGHNSSRGATPEAISAVTFFEAVSYVFYFPCFLTGPFLSFEEFRKGMATVVATAHTVAAEQRGASATVSSNVPVSDDTSARCVSRTASLVRLLKDVAHLAVVAICVDAALHFLYFSALLQEVYYLISASNMTLFSLSFIQAGFFHAKYVVMYGVTSALMRFDGIQPPDAPCCLVIQYSSSDIWRKFDTGLYNFVKQYIYIPLGGSAYGVSWQMITSFVCFAFISYWHGMETHVYVWAAVNYVTVVMEKMHLLLLKTEQWQSFVGSIGPTAAAHVHLVARLPICILSLWSMFLFLGQTHVGYNLYKKILRNGGPESHFSLLLFSYCILVGLMGFHEGVITGLKKPRDYGRVKKIKGKK